MTDNACCDDMIRFWTSLTRGICAGQNLLTALESAHEELESSEARKIIVELISDVRNGLRLSEAMAKQPKAFSKAAVCFVEGGEYAGIVDRALMLILESTWRCPTCGCWDLPRPE